ncbi:hypothetical protein QYE76_053701 [Lolium multiflorum]|uniref:Uncharacterized protein n=1 Tax=Lolium multiflorum TaxID=4521 RepID=A0AAD8WK40_LOLMU|nr:hypothetical protein QYE76_053701 [Lolium multiflorum]
MDRQEREGATANGFGCRWLQIAEARALLNARYPVPSEMCCPGGGALSRGGLPVSPVPMGTERDVEIYDHFWELLTPESGTTRGGRRTRTKRGRHSHSSSSAPGRTLAWVLGSIADGNDPPLQMPPRQLQLAALRGNGQWAARRKASSSSRSSSSQSSSSRGSSARRRHGGGGVVISKRHQPSLPRQHEWTPPPEYKAKDDPEEFPGMRQAQLESFAATDEFAEAWSAADHRRA